MATSVQSFCAYQQDEAWTWEHLALTRARVMAGDKGLGDQIEAFRRTLLAAKGKGATVRADVAEMRVRVQAAKPALGACEAKNGPGRIMAIELFAQMMALMAGSPARGVERQIAAGLAGGQIAAGAAVELTAADANALLGAYRMLWRLQSAARLLTDGPVDVTTLGEGGRAFLLRETSQATSDALSESLNHVTGLAAGVINATLGQDL